MESLSNYMCSTRIDELPDSFEKPAIVAGISRRAPRKRVWPRNGTEAPEEGQPAQMSGEHARVMRLFDTMATAPNEGCGFKGAKRTVEWRTGCRRRSAVRVE